MIDFHSHILPGMDDGAEDVAVSLAMLRESQRQGVDLICATSHFYAQEEDPASFLARRSEAAASLREAMRGGGLWPEIRLGAEVLYFPGISDAGEVSSLTLEGTPFLLIEPPLIPWTDSMLDEIEQCTQTIRCIPVIAHIDRYMRLLRDYSLLNRVRERRVLVQANASFFLRRETALFAVHALREGAIHFIGSDCHDLGERGPNLGPAAERIARLGAAQLFTDCNERLYQLLEKKLNTST